MHKEIYCLAQWECLMMNDQLWRDSCLLCGLFTIAVDSRDEKGGSIIQLVILYECGIDFTESLRRDNLSGKWKWPNLRFVELHEYLLVYIWKLFPLFPSDHWRIKWSWLRRNNLSCKSLCKRISQKVLASFIRFFWLVKYMIMQKILAIKIRTES